MATVSLPRPAERVAILSLVLVFLCGSVVGGLVMSYWGHTVLHPGNARSGALTMSTDEWKQKLDLSDDQTRQLTSILDDFALYYDHLLSDGNTRIMQILNPEQQRRYERMIREHRP